MLLDKVIVATFLYLVVNVMSRYLPTLSLLQRKQFYGMKNICNHFISSNQIICLYLVNLGSEYQTYQGDTVKWPMAKKSNIYRQTQYKHTRKQK